MTFFRTPFLKTPWYATPFYGGVGSASHARGGDGGSDDAKPRRRRALSRVPRDPYANERERMARLAAEDRERMAEEEIVMAMLLAADDE